MRRDIERLEAEKAAKEREIMQLQSEPSSLFDRHAESGSQATTYSPKEKISLFLMLFGARRDVYSRYWENKTTGKRGYSPACAGGFATAAEKRYLPLDEQAVEAHLRGQQAVGVYALRQDDSCIFVAADFDGNGWKENVSAYKAAADAAGVAAVAELSRSGNGAHAWIFFAEPVPATLARQLATLLLAKASGSRPTMSLSTYDRLFPNQDTMPRGGFGNLIALPLAGGPRKEGKTVFLDTSLKPFADQWAFLASVRRHTRDELDRILGRLAPMPPLSPTPNDDIAASLARDEAALDLSRPTIRPGFISGDLALRLDSSLHIPRTIPVAILAALKRIASFANPVFYQKLRLRFATYNTPRFLFAGEWQPDRLVLPRGVLDAAVNVLESAGANVVIHDARPEGARIRWKFCGELRPEQEAAVRDMAKNDYGVLCAPPGAGKTVMGCALAARHRTATLVLVHRAILLDQWRREAGRFLGIAGRKEIGIWRGATRRLTRRFDIAMLPSLVRLDDLASVFTGYGLVIVDECHHVPAATFESLLKACPCRKIVGLTATPNRKDGLEKLLHLQCGPVRHTMRASDEGAVSRIVHVCPSSFRLPDSLGGNPPIHAVWDALVADQDRTRQIAEDVRSVLREGRFPLVLSDRTAHLDQLEAELKTASEEAPPALFRLESGMGKRRWQAVRDEIGRVLLARGRAVLLATASLIGEGYDLPQLDTLFLAMPLSFKGRLIQYAGRLHRDHADKREVRVYDYVDKDNALTAAMFRRRSAAYRQMGYRMVTESGGESTTQLNFG